MRQATVTEIENYVAQTAARFEDEFAAYGGSPFKFSPNGFGWHARCKECGEGFTETGGATVGRLMRHAAGHAVA